MNVRSKMLENNIHNKKSCKICKPYCITRTRFEIYCLCKLIEIFFKKKNISKGTHIITF